VSVACCAVAATEPPPHDEIAGTNATERTSIPTTRTRQRSENAARMPVRLS
jgi:hypothetical protein